MKWGGNRKPLILSKPRRLVNGNKNLIRTAPELKSSAFVLVQFCAGILDNCCESKLVLIIDGPPTVVFKFTFSAPTDFIEGSGVDRIQCFQCLPIPQPAYSSPVLKLTRQSSV
jgi:hypothetical protein